MNVGDCFYFIAVKSNSSGQLKKKVRFNLK